MAQHFDSVISTVYEREDYGHQLTVRCENVNAKHSRGEICSLLAAYLSSNQSMHLVSELVLPSFDSLHNETIKSIVFLNI